MDDGCRMLDMQGYRRFEGIGHTSTLDGVTPLRRCRDKAAGERLRLTATMSIRGFSMLYRGTCL